MFKRLLTLDPGTSDSKIIYRCGNGKNISRASLLLMPPLVAEIERQAMTKCESMRLVELLPEERAWVDYDGKCYAVGRFAAQNAFFTTVNFDLKYEEAVVKVLAAVGVAAAKEGLPPEFELALSVPLPYSEWEDRQRLERALRMALLDFSFCGTNYSIILDHFICVPEGVGHLMLRIDKLAGNARSKYIASMMVGFRDLSLIHLDCGEMKGNTVSLGMANLVDKVLARTSGQESRSLVEAIVEAKSLDPKWFEHLPRSRDVKNRSQEAIQITEAVKLAKEEYWQQVKNYLDKYFPVHLDEIVIGGGTAYYLFDRFKDWLNNHRNQSKRKVEIFWSASLIQDVKREFGIDREGEKLSSRLTDAYALFLQMQNQVSKINRARKMEEL